MGYHQGITTNSAIGDFGNATVLTGAGWSRNGGGRLARALWEDLVGHREVQANQPLRQLLLAEPSSQAYAIAQGAPYTAADPAHSFARALNLVGLALPFTL